jgi:hypothetical protein
VATGAGKAGVLLQVQVAHALRRVVEGVDAEEALPKLLADRGEKEPGVDGPAPLCVSGCRHTEQGQHTKDAQAGRSQCAEPSHRD